MKEDIKEKPHYLGHRERLRQRLLDAPKGTLPDYEILEMLLFLSKPRGDVKPLAKELIKTFGSFGRVLNADTEALKGIKGIGESTVASLRIVQESVERLLKEEVGNQPVLKSWKALLDYCRAAMGHLTTEQFRVLYLNNDNVLIADEVQGEGTVNHTPLYPREVVKRALYLGASSVILVHKHPSGNPAPSKDDIALTHQVIAAAKTVGVSVHDHLIISATKHFSFKSNGLM